MRVFLSNYFVTLRDTVPEVSVLVIYERSRLFVKTFTADGKYSLSIIWNFQKLLQMQLSKILKTFSQYLAQFLKSTSNFKRFEKKYESCS